MLKSAVKLPITLYRFLISPLISPRCRYYPTCSCYAGRAIDKHGVVKGLFLAAMRLCRCHPFSKHPVDDPVPDKLNWSIDLRRLIGYKRGNINNQ